MWLHLWRFFIYLTFFLFWRRISTKHPPSMIGIREVKFNRHKILDPSRPLIRSLLYLPFSTYPSYWYVGLPGEIDVGRVDLLLQADKVVHLRVVRDLHRQLVHRHFELLHLGSIQFMNSKNVIYKTHLTIVVDSS